MSTQNRRAKPTPEEIPEYLLDVLTRYLIHPFFHSYKQLVEENNREYVRTVATKILEALR